MLKEFWLIQGAKNMGLTLKEKICNSARSLRLKTRKFSIISNNCVAWAMYRQFNMRYTSPTIGMFFVSEDYIRFLECFPYCITQPLTFLDKSRHSSVEDMRVTNKWPIGSICDAEIQFSHYISSDVVLATWNRRVKRLVLDNMFVIFSDHYDFREELLEKFKQLPFQHKLFLSGTKRSDDCALYVPEFAGMFANRYYEKYMYVVKWLNGEKDWRK